MDDPVLPLRMDTFSFDVPLDLEETSLFAPEIDGDECQMQESVPTFDDFSLFFPEEYVPIKLEPTSLNSSSAKTSPDAQPNKKRRRQRPPNPDADLIAEATEANMKLYDIDPNSKEGKKQKRQIRNRLSAQIHRDRKKEYIETLERRVSEREAMIKEMEAKMDVIIQENNLLRNELLQLQPHRTFGPSHNHPRSYSASSTTSESDDDSVSSRWSGESTRKSLPLLSLAFLLSFVFFGMPLDDLSSLSLSPSIVAPSPPTVWSEQHHGRVLLDNPDHYAGQVSPYYMLPQTDPIKTLAPVQSLPVSPHWKAQSRLMDVFPRVQISEQRVHVKRNLRSRHSKNFRGNSSDHNASVIEWQPDQFNSGEYSRVRLTDGAALLHPQLLSALPSASTENLQQETQKALTRWTGSTSVVPSQQSSDTSSPSLLMVMPASLVQWGAVWQEHHSESDKQDIMRALLRGMNWTDVSGLNGEEPNDLSSIWIEIGCTVNRVQIVHNVTQI